MLSNLRPDHPRRVVCGAIWRVPMKITDRSWSMHEQAFATFFAIVTLTLTQWPSYTNLTHRDIPGVQIWTFYVKVYHSYRLRDIHTYIQTDREKRLKVYTTPLRECSKIRKSGHCLVRYEIRKPIAYHGTPVQIYTVMVYGMMRRWWPRVTFKCHFSAYWKPTAAIHV